MKSTSPKTKFVYIMATLFVSLTYIFDQNLNYFATPKPITIPADSTVAGFKVLPVPPPIPGTTAYEPTINCLWIKTKEQGDIYLNMTLAQYNAAIAGVAVPIAGQAQVKWYTIGTDASAGTTITDAAFAGGTAQVITINGWAYKPAAGAISGTTLTLPQAVVNDDVVGVQFTTS